MRLLSLRRFCDLGFCLGREDRKPSNRLVRAFNLPRNVDSRVFTPVFRQHDRSSMHSEGSGDCERGTRASDVQRGDVYPFTALVAPIQAR